MTRTAGETPLVGLSKESRHLLYAYYLSLVLLLAASFFTHERLWGINSWGYFPVAVPIALFAAGLVAPLLPVFRVTGAAGLTTEQTETSGDRSYWLFCLVVILLLGGTFYLLRARTHFLGDGYQIISRLAQGAYHKDREFGESVVHVWVMDLLGVEGKEGARLAYQLVSGLAGVVFLALAAVFARSLFSGRAERRLFFLGIASGGYMLLYFGYVENYSLFVLSVMVYSVGGLLVALGKIDRRLIWPLLAMTIFFHVLGITLIASAVYVFWVNTRMGRRLAKTSRRIKRFILALAALVAIAAFVYFYAIDYFFRFSIVPLLEDWLTLEGYTMISFKHILDFLNLMLLLLPALPVLIVLLAYLPVKQTFRAVPYRFLALTCLSTLGAVFIFDPKLGMPRDWDLFSFAGVPLVIGFFYVLLDRRNRVAGYVGVAALSIVLGFLSLFPRAAAQASADTSIAMVRNYMDLDRIKNRYTRFILAQYYRDAGDSTRENEELERWKREFPERELIGQAWRLQDRASASKVSAMLRQVIQINPHYSDAWSNLAAAYYQLGKYDSGLYFCRIADGLNPNSPPILANLGTGYYYKGEYERGEKILLRAMSLDTTFYEIPYNLSHLYQQKGDRNKAYRFLKIAASKPGAIAAVFSELGEYYLLTGDFENARRAYDVALRKGLDSTVVRKMEERFPGLKRQ